MRSDLKNIFEVTWHENDIGRAYPYINGGTVMRHNELLEAGYIRFIDDSDVGKNMIIDISSDRLIEEEDVMGKKYITLSDLGESLIMMRVI